VAAIGGRLDIEALSHAIRDRSREDLLADVKKRFDPKALSAEVTSKASDEAKTALLSGLDKEKLREQATARALATSTPCARRWPGAPSTAARAPSTSGSTRRRSPSRSARGRPIRSCRAWSSAST
jgi:hypothetical protein